ncbi:MAG TPA: hypothetical protein VIZ18_09355, partial [Ktedonobacteraceae bacterium]
GGIVTNLFLTASLLLGASGIYLYVVAWSFRASKQRVFSLPWLLLPLSGALLAGITLALSVPASPASPVPLRLLELLAHLCTILLIWTIAGKIVPAYRLAGTWLYAWNPLVLIELAVYANTAGVVTCLLLLAVALLLAGTPSSSLVWIVPAFCRGGGRVDDGRGRLRRPRPFATMKDPTPAGDATESERLLDGFLKNLPVKARFQPNQLVALALVGLALRINFMTLLLAPLLLWFMVRHRRGVGSALGGFAWRALVVLGVFVVAYLPDWRGSETFLAITNGLRLFDFANSPLSLIVAPARSFFTFVAQRAHFPSLMQPTTAADMTVLATSFFLFALLYLREMGRIRAQIRLHSENVEITRNARPTLPSRPVGTGGRVGWMWGSCACPRSGAILTGSDDVQREVLQRDEDERIERVILEESQGNEDRHKAPALPLPGPLSLQDRMDDGVESGAYDTLFTGWAVVIVGYIVLAATVFLPGYIVWGVWVVALRRFDTLSVCVLLLSCSALLYYPLQWFALASTGFLLPLCVFGIPLVYLVVQYCLPTGRMERKKVLK